MNKLVKLTNSVSYCGQMQNIEAVRYVLGLDPSICHTGWALFDRVDGIFTYGVFEPPKEMVGDVPRMNFMLESVIRKIPPSNVQVSSDTKVFIEGLAFSAQGNVALQLAGVGYILRLALWKRGVEYKEVTPNQGKKFLTGKHQAEKNLMLLKVYQRYNIECGNDNIADAVNFNMIGRTLLGWRTAENQAERDVVAQLTSTLVKVRKTRKAKKAA